MTNQDGTSESGSQAYSVYHVTDKWHGGTLAKVLKEFLDGSQGESSSWGQVRRRIINRHVQVNGNLCLDESRRLRSGDVIRLWNQPRPVPVRAEDIRIAYTDRHLCVVEKPAGVTSVRHARENSHHKARLQLQPTLDELVIQAAFGIEKPNNIATGHKRTRKRSERPHAPQIFSVHRLDHHTSGLMLFAWTVEAQQKLIGMFRRHRILREYVGVCHGKIEPRTIRSFLVRDRGDGLRGSLPENHSAHQAQSAQEAITHIVGTKSIGRGDYSLFRCRLETGRTHQIRIHLSELGHRLCGEQVYVFDANGNRQEDLSGAARQALHSDRLSFKHPITEQPLAFEMPWPEDLARWVRTLENASRR